MAHKWLPSKLCTNYLRKAIAHDWHVMVNRLWKLWIVMGTPEMVARAFNSTDPYLIQKKFN